MAEILQKLGVRGIFEKGEFSPINGGREPLKVGDILHKATVDVDTEGTEAAAAAGVEIVPLMIASNTANLLVDRPFLFVIRDKKKQGRYIQFCRERHDGDDMRIQQMCTDMSKKSKGRLCDPVL